MNELPRFAPIAIILTAATAIAAAQIPVSKEPHHRVVFANTDLQIFDVNLGAGQTTADHRHDRDIATISMTSGADTRTRTAGQEWSAVRPRRPLGDASVAEYAGKPESHTIENVGTTPYQLFAVENLRASGWSATPPVKAAGTTLTADSKALRLYDVRLVAGTPQTSHTHAVPTIAVLISGVVLSEGPDEKAKAHAPAPVGLKRLDQPGQWLLVPRGDTHHLVRLSTGDARLVEVEVR